MIHLLFMKHYFKIGLALAVGGLLTCILGIGGCTCPGNRDHVYAYSFNESPGVVLAISADECQVRIDEGEEVVRCYWQTGTGEVRVFESRVRALKYFRKVK